MTIFWSTSLTLLSLPAYVYSACGVVIISKGTPNADHFLLVCVWVATYDVSLVLYGSDYPILHTLSMVGIKVLVLSVEVWLVIHGCFEPIHCASYYHIQYFFFPS